MAATKKVLYIGTYDAFLHSETLCKSLLLGAIFYISFDRSFLLVFVLYIGTYSKLTPSVVFKVNKFSFCFYFPLSENHEIWRVKGLIRKIDKVQLNKNKTNELPIYLIKIVST